MPDKRKHHGKAPQDDRLFSDSNQAILRQAVQDLSWLLSRGYADKSSLKLVGDRYNLVQRQRLALMRCACSREKLCLRQQKKVPANALTRQRLLIDGYNLLTTIETALAGGVILKCQDGSYRDIAGVHGTYRKVEETIPAIELIGQILYQLDCTNCTWLLDSPVSNSGRLKRIIEEYAEKRHWNWIVQLVPDPDQLLILADEIVVTSDSVILDRCGRWFNLAEVVIQRISGVLFLVDLSETR